MCIVSKIRGVLIQSKPYIDTLYILFEHLHTNGKYHPLIHLFHAKIFENFYRNIQSPPSSVCTYFTKVKIGTILFRFISKAKLYTVITWMDDHLSLSINNIVIYLFLLWMYSWFLLLFFGNFKDSEKPLCHEEEA